MLRISRPGISDEEEDGLRGGWSTLHKVTADLAAKGIRVPEEPPPFPLEEVTTTLVASDSQDYMLIAGRYLRWLNFITPNLAKVQCELLETRNEMTNIETVYKQKAREANEHLPKQERKTKDEIEEEIQLDIRYQELLQIEQIKRQEELLLEDRKDVLSRNLRAMSRNIEMKKVDLEANRMVSNMPQRRPFVRGGNQ